MNWQDGLLMGFIGCSATVIGFLIAFYVANRNFKKLQEKNKPLTSVEKSLKDLQEIPGSKASDDCQ